MDYQFHSHAGGRWNFQSPLTPIFDTVSITMFDQATAGFLDSLCIMHVLRCLLRIL